MNQNFDCKLCINAPVSNMLVLNGYWDCISDLLSSSVISFHCTQQHKTHKYTATAAILYHIITKVRSQSSSISRQADRMIHNMTLLQNITFHYTLKNFKYAKH